MKAPRPYKARARSGKTHSLEVRVVGPSEAEIRKHMDQCAATATLGAIINGAPDHDAHDAVRTLLRMLGEDPKREGLIDTPRRVVAALREWTSGRCDDPARILSTTFKERCDEMVVVGPIPFHSLCEHHLAPFTGVAVIGYVPSRRVVGLSKLPRLVHCFARRLQVQERLTRQIAEAMLAHLKPRGVGVLVSASHLCCESRGVRTRAPMTTSAMHGVMRDKPAARSEFLALARAKLAP